MGDPRGCKGRPHRLSLVDSTLHRCRGHVPACPLDEVKDVAEREGAIPFDASGVEPGHVDGRCSFESIMLKHDLTDDAALARLAGIVHAADVSEHLHAAPEGPGLKAIANGFSLLLGKD